MKKSILIVFLISFSIAFGQKVDYELRMEKPQNHYFQVKMTVSEITSDELIVKMPVWAPGSYLVREFSKNMNLVTAQEGNKSLNVEKLTKNAWKINTKGKKKITISYEVYAFELSVRTSFLDLNHGFVSGSSVFMYVQGAKENSGNLTIYPHASFKKVTTALPLSKEEILSDDHRVYYQYTNYDQLVDCPIEIGNQELFSFDAAGVKHEVAIFGVGNHDIEKLKVDMARIVEAATGVFGQNPNKNYTFIIHNVVDGQGGLEHTNSTTLSVNRWTYEGSKYQDFLSLVAHEYFHLWNVKRIRPIELGPFNYDEEVYTTLLWVMEGFTSYYDELLMVRAGYLAPEQYVSKLQSTANYVEGTMGSRVQPLAHSSFDAWIKGYRPNENSSNTGMTYYSRGQVIAALLDAKIIANSKGKKSLDDLMRALYADYYEGKNRGFTEAEFQTTLEKVVGEKMDDFFAKYIHGTEIPDYASIFGAIGVKAAVEINRTPSLGASFKEVNGNAVVRQVRSNSSAEDAGLSVNDEILGINGFRSSYSDVESTMKDLQLGDSFQILYARDQIMNMLTIEIKAFERPSVQINLNGNPAKKALRDYWLRKN